MVVLVVWLIVCVVIVACLDRWRRSERTALGLMHEQPVAADDSATPVPTLYSARYRLVGRPDQLVRSGRMLVPVEHKPRARRLQDSHILQVAAQCLLVEEVYGVRPTHGLVVLAGGMQERVEFTSALEQRLLDTMAEMRSFCARMLSQDRGGWPTSVAHADSARHAGTLAGRRPIRLFG
jgi:CRISPR-associated exonuclease Cas4